MSFTHCLLPETRFRQPRLYIGQTFLRLPVTRCTFSDNHPVFQENPRPVRHSLVYAGRILRTTIPLICRRRTSLSTAIRRNFRFSKWLFGCFPHPPPKPALQR